MTNADIDRVLLRRYDVPGPRYTSYPTAPHFHAFTPADYVSAVQRSMTITPCAPLSLYVHAPFCANPCFYCGCTRVITRDQGLIGRYLQVLLREIELQGALFDRQRPVEQLHFGGGTPTYFSDAQLSAVFEQIERSFGLAAAERREFSIEIDPRTVDAARLAKLIDLGINRISLGVQDFDPVVQAAVNRLQAPELTETLVRCGRRQGLRSISFDLIYGLPRQTVEGFGQTLDRVIAAQPDRIAIYGYAHLPSMFKAQRQIRDTELPDAETRLRLLQLAISKLVAVGYVHIGMDHFARPDDELVLAQQQNRLQRNFQGYSTRAGLDLVGVGMSSISRIDGAYSQNARGLGDYQAAIDSGALATARGLVLTQEDQIRAAVIERILCGRDVRYAALRSRFGIDVRRHLRPALARLAQAELDGLVELLPDRLRITPRGRYFLRVIAMPFDAYLAPSQGEGSVGIPMARAV